MTLHDLDLNLLRFWNIDKPVVNHLYLFPHDLDYSKLHKATNHLLAELPSENNWVPCHIMMHKMNKDLGCSIVHTHLCHIGQVSSRIAMRLQVDQCKNDNLQSMLWLPRYCCHIKGPFCIIYMLLMGRLTNHVFLLFQFSMLIHSEIYQGLYCKDRWLS